MPKNILVSNTDIVKLEDNEYYFNGKSLVGNEGDKRENKEIAEDKITEIINQFLGKQYENTLVLTGAGSSILTKEESVSDLDTTKHSGKTVGAMNDLINKKLEKNRDLYSLEEISNLVKYMPDKGSINIEDLMSKISKARDFIHESKINKFDRTVREIQKTIKSSCEIELSEFHKHGEFINKLVAKKNSYNRMKIFTTNYDTLFEQAFKREGFILVDGFSYEFPRTFNSLYYDYDFVIRGENKIVDEPNFVNKVAHIYKIHGSIDWKQNSSGKIIKYETSSEEDSLMIYPQRAKFEQSYETPFFDLFSRFQLELRKSSTLLIVIGFSFADKHIKSMVKSALINNSELNILIVNPNIDQEEYNDFFERAKKYNNVMLLGKTFGEFVDSFQKQEAYSNNLFIKDGDEIE